MADLCLKDNGRTDTGIYTAGLQMEVDGVWLQSHHQICYRQLESSQSLLSKHFFNSFQMYKCGKKLYCLYVFAYFNIFLLCSEEEIFSYLNGIVWGTHYWPVNRTFHFTGVVFRIAE